MQLIRAAADVRVEGELDRIFLLLKDVLGEEASAAPAIEEGGMEAGVGLFQFKFNRVIINGCHRFDVIHEETMGIEAFILNQGFDCVDNIGSSKRLAIRPCDALAQRDRKACEIFVVGRVCIRRTIDDLTRGEIDRPEWLVCQILHTAVLPFPTNPLVEVVWGTNTTGENSANQSLAAREGA